VQLPVDHDRIAVVRRTPHVGQASVPIVHGRVVHLALNVSVRR
jgi:hypothetical protein